MARQLRIEFPGAVYHVTSRGDRREPIFEDDQDRLALLEVVSRAMIRFDARVLAFCLMGNHYHFVVTTAQANLSRVMRQIHGVYTQGYNRRHGKAAGQPSNPQVVGEPRGTPACSRQSKKPTFKKPSVTSAQNS